MMPRYFHTLTESCGNENSKCLKHKIQIILDFFNRRNKLALHRCLCTRHHNMADSVIVEISTKPLASKYEGSIKNLVFCTLCACIGALNFGFTIGYSSPAIPTMIKRGVLKPEASGWFGSLMTVGALLGGPFGGYCIEKIGRKKTILLSALPFLVGYGVITSAQEPHHLFIGRFLTGIGSGAVTVCVPMYIAEISTKSKRGVMGSCVQLMIVIGICIAYMLPGVSFEWREMANVGIFLGAVTIIGAFAIPETPRWLLARSKKLEAAQALAAVRDSHADVQDELHDIEEGLDMQEELSWGEFFKRPELKRPLILSIVVMMFQQTSGINAVMFYSTSILETAIQDKAYEGTVIIGFVQVVATLAACLLMDRAGRKKLLVIAGSVMAFTHFLFGLYYRYLFNSTSYKVLSTWFPIVCLTIFIIGFSLGWGPIPMLIMSEIFPSRGKGTAGAIAIFCNWLTAFLVTKEFLTMQAVLGNDGVFYLFSLSCLLSVWFVAKYLPETKGKSLEDIELYFLGRSTLKV